MPTLSTTEPSPPNSMRPWHELIGALVAFKLVYCLLIVLCTDLLPPQYNTAALHANIQGTAVQVGSRASYYEAWDAQPYLQIAAHGYRAGGRFNAFYPLWPGLIHLGAKVTGTELASALLLANSLAILGLALLHRSVSRVQDTPTADRTVLLLLAFPGALFFAFPYTEALFLVISVIALQRLHANSPWGAGLAGFVGALTRPTGVLWAVPMAVDILRKRQFRALPAALLPVLGFGAYLLTMRLLTGDAFAGFRGQETFIAHPSLRKVFDIPGFLATYFAPQLQVHHFLYSAIDRLWFLWYVITLPTIYRKDKTLFAYALVMGLVPAMSASMMSFTRYMVMLLPSFWVTAEFFGLPRRQAGFAVLLAGLFGLQMLFLIRQMNYYWVG